MSFIALKDFSFSKFMLSPKKDEIFELSDIQYQEVKAFDGMFFVKKNAEPEKKVEKKSKKKK